MTKVLFVVTAADRWTLDDGTVHPSGYWAEELAVPHRIFSEAGWEITVATPGGKTPTLDQLSLGISGGMPGKRREVKTTSTASPMCSPTRHRWIRWTQTNSTWCSIQAVTVRWKILPTTRLQGIC